MLERVRKAGWSVMPWPYKPGLFMIAKYSEDGPNVRAVVLDLTGSKDDELEKDATEFENTLLGENHVVNRIDGEEASREELDGGSNSGGTGSEGVFSTTNGVRGAVEGSV